MIGSGALAATPGFGQFGVFRRYRTYYADVSSNGRQASGETWLAEERFENRRSRMILSLRRKAGDEILVEAKQSGDRVRFSVIDYGPDISNYNWQKGSKHEALGPLDPKQNAKITNVVLPT